VSDPGFLRKLIRAYHGSPYAFDKFDPTKIGSGEGAQAYGYGHYFTDKEDIARGYRDKLSGDRYELPTGETYSPDDFQHINVRAKGRQFGGDLQSTLDYARKLQATANEQTLPLLYRDIDTLKGIIDKNGGRFAKSPGHMYDVNLGVNPQDLLNWERPLSEQPAIQAPVRDLLSARRPSEMVTDADRVARHRSWLDNDLSGAAAYHLLGRQEYGPRIPAHEVSALLKDQGIPGIKYLDGFSRNAGEGTSNYVMFPGTEDLININRRYADGGPVEMAGGGQYDVPKSGGYIRNNLEDMYAGPKDWVRGAKALGKAVKESPYFAPGTPERDANYTRFMEGSHAPPRVYHGTTSPDDFPQFSVGAPSYAEDNYGEAYRRIGSGADPTTYLGSHFAEEPEIANKFAKGLYGEREHADAGHRVYPVHLRATNPYLTSDSELRSRMMGGRYDHPHVEEELLHQAESRRISFEDADQLYSNDPVFRHNVNASAAEGGLHYDNPDTSLAEEMAARLRAALTKAGHDSVKYKNEIEGGNSWIAFTPEQIKSAIGNRGTYDPMLPDMNHSHGGPVDTPTEGEGGMYGAPDSMFNTPESLAAALYPQHGTAYGGGGKVRSAFQKAGQLARDALLGHLPEYKKGEETYLRYGKWPENERSQNFAMGHAEDGVSVYPLDYHGGLPLDWSDEGEHAGRVATHMGRHDSRGDVFSDESNYPRFLVQGDRVGSGHDGEPLLQVVSPLSLEWHSPQLGDRKADTLSHHLGGWGSRLPAIVKPFDGAYGDGGPVEMSGGGSELIKRAAGLLKPSRLGDMMDEITRRHGASQGRRFEQASDSANLDRYSDDALRQTFGRSDTGLFTTMPPGRFEDFAAPIPDRFIHERPYFKWQYHPDADMLSPNQQSYDEYMRTLKTAAEYGGGLRQVPYLKLNKGLPFNDVASHEGRHRMRMFDEEGDKNSLVQLLPTGGYGLFDDRVERLMKHYFPHGNETPYMPEKSSVYDAFRPMVQFPNPIFAEGGEVHMALGGTPPNTAPAVPDMPQLPESEGAGYFRNNDNDNYAGPADWLKRLGAPTIQRPGKVQDVHNWATKVGGAEQGRRVEQAADLTNLDHFSSNALHETFAPGNSSLLMALPPSVFEKYSARLPAEYMARTPYGRWKNNVPGQERIPDSQKTMDAYLAQLRDHMDRGGANEVPAMWLAPPRPLYGEVVDHQGRHRARALAQAGDENMLLQIRPSNDGDMRGSLAERLARLTDKYFPSGAATRFEPQMDWKRRTPLSFPFAPFAEGGEVHMALGGTPPNTGGQYDAPEPEGGGYIRNNLGNMYVGPPEMVKEGARTVLARQHMKDTPRGRAAPPDPRIQTVTDPERMVYPGIYKDPNVIAEEASRRLMRDQGKDGPMSLLFGHTRASLDELSQGRDLEGMRPWPLRQAYTPPGGSTGSAVSEQVLTRRNANRLLDIHGEAMKYPGLRETRSWYEMLPLYQRMDELGVPIDEQRLFNQRTGIFSAAASPVSEINRGTLAHHLAQQGRIEDFVKYGGVAAKNRLSLLGFPDDLLDMKSHAYHRTAQAPTLAEIEMSGGYYPKEHKVGTYVAATDPVFPNYTRPVADSHIARGVGYSDVRPGKLANVKANLSNPEYTDFAPWWENSIAGNTGLRPRDQQALLWNVLGPQTGVRYIGPSKLELMSNQMMKASKRLGVSPEQARDMVLRGEAGAYKEGGTVEDQYHPIWQQSFAGGGQPEEEPRLDGFDAMARSRPDEYDPVSASQYPWLMDKEDFQPDYGFREIRDPLDLTHNMDNSLLFQSREPFEGRGFTLTPEEKRAKWLEQRGLEAKPESYINPYDLIKTYVHSLGQRHKEWKPSYSGESLPWQALQSAGDFGRVASKSVTGDLGDTLSASMRPWDGSYEDRLMQENDRTRQSERDIHPLLKDITSIPALISQRLWAAPAIGDAASNLATPANSVGEWADNQTRPLMGALRNMPHAVGTMRDMLSGVRPEGRMEPEYYDHGGSVEDQYHPIWSQNFKGGGGVHDILGTLGGLAGNLIPIPVLGPMLGKFAGHTLGNLIEGGSDEIADDAARDFTFGMADPDTQGWAFGGPIGPTLPKDDFTSGGEEPGMPSFGPGIPGFDVDPLRTNPQVARDAAERNSMLRQVQADSQKGLAKQMKAKESGGGGGGMGDIMGMVKMAAQFAPLFLADGGSIPAPNGEQPWMYGGGALMARGGYLRSRGGMNG